MLLDIDDNELHEDKLLTTLSRLRVVVPIEVGVPAVSLVNKLKLPTIPLPKFSNARTENIEKFILNFGSIVSKHPLTSFEKFTFFKNQLSNAVSEQSYETVKDLLIKAFDSTLLQKYDAIKLLSELILPYKFIGELCVLHLRI